MSTNEEIKAKVEEARARRKSEKFTAEEMKTIETIKKSYDELTVQLGQLNIEELVLNESRENLNTSFSNLRIQEKEFANSLSDKYGKGQLDLDTGIFNPAQ